MEKKRWLDEKKMEIRGLRGKAAGLLIKFLAFMLVCSLISQWIYTGRMVRVTAGSSRSMSLSHRVEAEGAVQQGSESAVFAPAGIRVGMVFGKPEQQVEAGELLLQLDCEDVRQLLEEKEKEAERLRLQLEAAKENQSIEEQARDKARMRAREDYDSAVAVGDSRIKDAKNAWEQAQRERNQLTGWEDFLASVRREDDTLKTLEENAARLQQELKELREQADSFDTGAGSDSTAADVSSQIAAKEQELFKAQAERDSWMAELTDSAKQQWEQQKQALEAAEEQARQAYEDSVNSRDQEVLAAARVLEDASQAAAADSSLALLAMDLEKAREECREYEELLEEEGRIYSPGAGMVTEVCVRTGERTGDSPVFFLASSEGELTFQALLTKEQKKYVNVGDVSSVSFDGGRKKLDGLVVEALTESREQENMYEMTLTIPAGQAVMGQSGTWSLTQKTENYSVCVPLAALHVDSLQQTYVLVLKTVQTFLGEELTVVKKPVKVLDKDDTYAALEAGAVGEEEKLVLASSGIVGDGDIVRMEEP